MAISPVHPERTKEAVGRRLVAIRTMLNLQAQELADQVGVAKNTWSQWETGRSMADLLAMSRVWDKTSVDLNFIFMGRYDTLPYELATKLREVVNEIEREPAKPKRTRFAKAHADKRRTQRERSEERELAEK